MTATRPLCSVEQYADYRNERVCVLYQSQCSVSGTAPAECFEVTFDEDGQCRWQLLSWVDGQFDEDTEQWAHIPHV